MFWRYFLNVCTQQQLQLIMVWYNAQCEHNLIPSPFLLQLLIAYILCNGGNRGLVEHVTWMSNGGVAIHTLIEPSNTTLHHMVCFIMILKFF